MKFGENSLVSSFPPRPDTELPGFAAFFKDLGPRGCKASSGTPPPPSPALPAWEERKLPPAWWGGRLTFNLSFLSGAGALVTFFLHSFPTLKPIKQTP